MVEVNLLPWRNAMRLRKKIKNYSVCCLILAILLSTLTAIIHIYKKNQEDQLQALSKQNLETRKIYKNLSKIRFIGFLSQAGRAWAVLELPSGEIKDVQVGSEVAIGDAKVISVSREQLVLVLPDNRLFTIKSSFK
jgi:Tfp pilus assembly protein PilN